MEMNKMSQAIGHGFRTQRNDLPVSTVMTDGQLTLDEKRAILAS
jgi:hypothetical protein